MVTKAAKPLSGVPGLDGMDFDDPAAPRHRVSISGHGETKTGKSSFGFWAPDPVVHFNLDRRIERVIDRFRSGDEALGLTRPRVIKVVDLKLPQPANRSFFTQAKELRDKDETERKAAEKLWEKFVHHYKAALASSLLPGGTQSIIIDTLTELYDLRLLAEFGRLQGFRQRERGGANGDMNELLRMSEDYNANLITLHQVKDEYGPTKKKDAQTGETTTEQERTGKRVIKGYAQTPYITQAHLVFKYNDVKKHFEIEVARCGTEASMNGRTYTEEDWAMRGDDGGYVYNAGPFAKVAADMTQTDAAEWMGG